MWNNVEKLYNQDVPAASHKKSAWSIRAQNATVGAIPVPRISLYGTSGTGNVPYCYRTPVSQLSVGQRIRTGTNAERDDVTVNSSDNITLRCG